MFNQGLICPDSTPNFFGLFDLSVAPSLLFYSYIPIIVVSLFFGIYVFLKDNKSLRSRLLFYLSLTFTLLLINEIITWIGSPVAVVLFGWQLVPVFRILVPIFTILFVFEFIEKKRISYLVTSIVGISLLTIIILLPTSLNIKYFDLANCEGIPGLLWNIVHGFEILSIFWLIIFGIRSYKRNKSNITERRVVVYLSLGAIIFLFIFFTASIWSDVTKIYEVGLLGPIGMFLFIAFLTFLIVRFRAFNIKLIASQALVVGLIVGIGAQFFFIQNITNQVLTGITLAIAIIFGYMLVRSVKLEVQRKEELESLSTQLAAANDKLHQLDKAKSEFISIASHQLRTPLTSIKGFASLLLEGTYGQVPETQRNALEKIYISNERLIHLVEDLLNISRIEAGRMEFDFQEAQIEDVIQEAVDTLELSAKQKNLYLHWQKPSTALPKLKIDITKIKEVISNMVDNAIKYTQKGGVTVRVEKGSFFDHDSREQKNVVRVSVSDSGIGMDKEELENIFNKFERGKAVSHYHTDGTGLGMYVGKKMAEAHHGKIWAESEGKGRGSRFVLELPVNIT